MASLALDQCEQPDIFAKASITLRNFDVTLEREIWMLHRHIRTASRRPAVLSAPLRLDRAVNKSDFGGVTILHGAVVIDASAAAIEVLLHASGVPNAALEGGEAALQVAVAGAQRGEHSGFRLRQGAIIDSEDDEHRTPLHLASEPATPIPVLGVLIGFGGNADDKSGATSDWPRDHREFPARWRHIGLRPSAFCRGSPARARTTHAHHWRNEVGWRALRAQ